MTVLLPLRNSDSARFSIVGGDRDFGDCSVVPVVLVVKIVVVAWRTEGSVLDATDELIRGLVDGVQDTDCSLA